MFCHDPKALLLGTAYTAQQANSASCMPRPGGKLPEGARRALAHRLLDCFAVAHIVKKRRRWARLLLALSLTLAIMIGLLAAGLFPQEPLRRFVERRLRAALGPTARLDHLHIVPGSLRAEIRGL